MTALSVRAGCGSIVCVGDGAVVLVTRYDDASPAGVWVGAVVQENRVERPDLGPDRYVLTALVDLVQPLLTVPPGVPFRPDIEEVIWPASCTPLVLSLARAHLELERLRRAAGPSADAAAVCGALEKLGREIALGLRHAGTGKPPDEGP